VSGYGKSRLEHNGVPKNAVNVLHKPFSRKELLDAVDKVFID
jgi:arsenate reductase-like glutaredoxin family protein